MISSLSNLSVSNQSRSQNTQKYAHYFNKITQELMNKITQLCSTKSTPLDKICCFNEISCEAKNPDKCTITIQDDTQKSKSYFGNSNKVMIFKIESQEIVRITITAKEAQEIKLRQETNELIMNSDPSVAAMLNFPENNLFSPQLNVKRIGS